MDSYAGQQDGPTLYQIRVCGLLGESWAAWLNGALVSLETEVGQTAITVAVPDQAALRGLLDRLWNANLSLISVTRIEEEHHGTVR